MQGKHLTSLGLCRGFELLLLDSGEGVRKRDFALDGTISGSRANSGLGYCNKSQLGGRKTRTRPRLYSIKKQQSLIVARGGRGFLFCGLDNVRVLSMTQQVYRGVLLLSSFIMVTGWPYLMLMFYEMCLFERRTPRPSWECLLAPDVRGSFSFSQQ